MVEIYGVRLVCDSSGASICSSSSWLMKLMMVWAIWDMLVFGLAISCCVDFIVGWCMYGWGHFMVIVLSSMYRYMYIYMYVHLCMVAMCIASAFLYIYLMYLLGRRWHRVL